MPSQESDLPSKEKEKMAIFQEAVTFKDVALVFTTEELGLLDLTQRQLYQDMMLENFRNLVAVGCFPLKAERLWLQEAEVQRNGSSPHESATLGRLALKHLPQEEVSCWHIWKQAAQKSTGYLQRKRSQLLRHYSIQVSDNGSNTKNHKGDSCRCLEQEDFSISGTQNYCQNRCLQDAQNQSGDKPVCVKRDLCVYADLMRKSSLCKPLKTNQEQKPHRCDDCDKLMTVLIRDCP
ncbi:zinc finger protein 227-like isoform X2 [Peromyscus californicus insignis]|uniref:zinc finger protein 227-like isoform X2 n=1 Tax=Peromyscus californicus insignis TaxID=564181 RepID=UPI0022A75549|nr:zinc finger protein 227-like isoform X2 [Peromyscus californicus insignis]